MYEADIILRPPVVISLLTYVHVSFVRTCARDLRGEHARWFPRRLTYSIYADVSRLCVRARAFNGAEYEHTDGSASLAPLQPSQGGVQQLQEVAADGVVCVTFWLQYQAEFGQRICVVGNCVGLGMWQHKAAPELQWNEGHLWSVTVEVPAAQVLEYKYVVMQPDGLTALHWQSGNNAVLALMVRPFAFFLAYIPLIE